MTLQVEPSVARKPFIRNKLISFREKLKEILKTTTDEKSVRQQMRQWFDEHAAFDNPADADDVFECWFRNAYKAAPPQPQKRTATAAIGDQLITSLREQGAKRDNKLRMEGAMLIFNAVNGKPAHKVVRWCDEFGATAFRIRDRAAKLHPRKHFRMTVEEIYDLIATSGHFNAPRKKQA